jgi:hypothetical protein
MSKLTLRDVVEILCHFNVKHTDFPLNRVVDQQVRGLASDSSRTIFVERDIGLQTARKVVIHELIHCKHYLAGDLDDVPNQQGEKIVLKEERETWKDLYGRKV